MPKLTTITAEWQQMITAISVNAADLLPLEALRQELSTTLAEFQDLSSKEMASRSERQQWTQKRQETLAIGMALASRLRSGLKLAYGSKTEKLVEFGIKPFRPRKSKANDPQPEAPGSNTLPADTR
jgi:hypothetical protein